ncbi:uncharacterized protein LOC115743569 [Rhodamnia argentea]|uniref:Uncharacterized protein LOC115743569 n=1 Tax=Rhodamnia argentea TaxID=178133 RepID=A0ABM3HP15_9MYRT|nr:uncharacterized protein LOC115743569 [Rhodamnia argentea]
MKRVDNRKDTTTLPVVTRDEEGKKRVEKVEVEAHSVDTLKHIERKLMDKGVQRMERHPADGLGGISRLPPKSGHGGKYTWEGPEDPAESELAPTPPAIDERDPNYVDEEAEEKATRGEDGEVAELVVGEVEVPKAREVGVARVDVDSRLQVDQHED